MKLWEYADISEERKREGRIEEGTQNLCDSKSYWLLLVIDIINRLEPEFPAGMTSLCMEKRKRENRSSNIEWS